MGMADGRGGRLQKIQFQVGDRRFLFAINPENYTHKKPHRTTAIKTKSRIVIEDFQNDIEEIVIKGTTGFNPTGTKGSRGINKIREMKQFLEDYAQAGGNGDKSPQDFYFYNHTNKESYIVHLSSEGVSFSQDVASPLTFKYEISFNVLRKAGQPSEDDIISPDIGNRDPSTPNYETKPDIGMGDKPDLDDNNGVTDDTGGGQFLPGNGYNPSGGLPTLPGFTPSISPFNTRGAVNPQAPSKTSSAVGSNGLGATIGYTPRRVG